MKIKTRLLMVMILTTITSPKTIRRTVLNRVHQGCSMAPEIKSKDREYTYCFNYYESLIRGTVQWNCSLRASKNCKAKIVVRNFCEIISGNLEHSHLPPRVCINPNGEHVRFIIIIKYP